MTPEFNTHLTRDTKGLTSLIVAGTLAVVVAYAGPLAILFRAADIAKLPGQAVSSWVWSVSIGAAISGLFLSWRLRQPIITAWSAPGSALLVTVIPGLTLNEVIGAYVVAGIAVTLLGVTGVFDRILKNIPAGIASGMLAGILFQFGTNIFRATAHRPLLTLTLLCVYLLFRRAAPRYCLVLMLPIGCLLAYFTGPTNFHSFALTLSEPSFTVPAFTWHATVSLALPLVLVSVTGQFLPGFSILRSSGYATPTRPVLVTTGLSSIAIAFTGGITIVLAAITAAICTGPDAHQNPAKRYIAGLASGTVYAIGGLFASSVVMLFAVLPTEFVAILAGLALLSAIATNLSVMVEDAPHREAGLLTFIATASNMNVFGLGSAFWGIVIGVVAQVILSFRRVK